MSLKGIGCNILMRLFSVFPIQDKAVFSSFDGKQFGDNPKALFEALKGKSSMQCVWILRNTDSKIDGAKIVKHASIRSLYELATAKLWVDNSRKRSWTYKRKNQFYVQTWHGNVCLKHIEKDAEKYLPNSYLRDAKHDSEIIDLILSGSKFRTNLYKKAFWYEGEILELGCPKSDSLFGSVEKAKDKISKLLNIPVSTKILLYVPTFRAKEDIQYYKIDWQEITKSLTQRWGNKWVVIVKLHPNIAEMQDLIPYSSSVINGSNYDNTDELILASDVILTDYSGCMFAALECHKKVLLYTPDLEEYTSQRGLYFNIKELPFPVAKTDQELCNIISSYDEELFRLKDNEFRNEIGFFDQPNSSNAIIDNILERIK